MNKCSLLNQKILLAQQKIKCLLLIKEAFSRNLFSMSRLYSKAPTRAITCLLHLFIISLKKNILSHLSHYTYAAHWLSNTSSIQDVWRHMILVYWQISCNSKEEHLNEWEGDSRRLFEEVGFPFFCVTYWIIYHSISSKLIHLSHFCC